MVQRSGVWMRAEDQMQCRSCVPSQIFEPKGEDKPASHILVQRAWGMRRVLLWHCAARGGRAAGVPQLVENANCGGAGECLGTRRGGGGGHTPPGWCPAVSLTPKLKDWAVGKKKGGVGDGGQHEHVQEA